MSTYPRMGAFEPSRRQWRNWQRMEPNLRQLTYRRLRAVLSDRCQKVQPRQDELLAALVRLAQRGDQAASAVVIDCLQPGLRRRAARYRMGLSPHEARAELNLGLWEAIVTLDTTESRHVASHLLERATDPLRRKARIDHGYRSRLVNDGDRYLAQQPDGGGDFTELVALLVTVAKVVSPIDAALVIAVDVDGVNIRDAGHQLSLGYEAAKKRRQRTHRHLARCWENDTRGPEMYPSGARAHVLMLHADSQTRSGAIVMASFFGSTSRHVGETGRTPHRLRPARPPPAGGAYSLSNRSATEPQQQGTP